MSGLTRRDLLAASVAGFVLASPARALGSLARALTLRELCTMSELAIVGTAVDAQSRWVTSHGRRRIVTDVRVRVDASIAGPYESSLVFRTLGGRIGDQGEIVHGEAMLLIGQPAVLFATAERDAVRRVAGMSQGHYPLRTVDGVVVLGQSPRSFSLVGDGARSKLLGKRLEVARRTIREAFDAR